MVIFNTGSKMKRSELQKVPQSLQRTHYTNGPSKGKNEASQMRITFDPEGKLGW
jgi:hypothetical protein